MHTNMHIYMHPLNTITLGIRLSLGPFDGYELCLSGFKGEQTTDTAELAQWVKGLAAKPGDLSLSISPIVRGEN